ncbi:relaxase/mobilization nuclease domain-containing protein [Robinsoniella peoriensis]|uniref:relaxase/mobilization nuclease domain-containing protein n=1 Tax=Robinsoniella peoriensis TaxID=180332 RepID=UPI0037528BF7
MAIFKFINKKYDTHKDLYNLVNYIKARAIMLYSPNIFVRSTEAICSQFLYYKKFYYKTHGNQAVHFCLSIDSKKLETHITQQDLLNAANMISLIFKNYQTIIALHTDKSSHWDIHIVCNSVSFLTGARFHISHNDFDQIMNEVAMILSRYNLALQSVNYYDEEGKLRKGSVTGPFLYQNKNLSL